MWCIPPAANAAFVCAMEDILEVYRRPYNPDKPLICMDEITKQLTKETRRTVAAKRGRPARVNYEYERNGVSNLFMFYEPFGGKRYVSVTDHRAKIDWAFQVKDLLDTHYTKLFHHRKPGDCWIDWKYTILPNMAAGSISLKSN